MDVETLNVVLDATYTPAVRGLGVADAAFDKTTAAAQHLETVAGQTGRAVQTAGADAASVEGQVAGVGAAFDKAAGAAATAARETDASLGAIGDETGALERKITGVSTAFSTIPAAAEAAAGGTDAALATTAAATRGLGAATVQTGSAVEAAGAKAARAGGQHEKHAGALKETGKEARGAASAVTGMGRAFAYASNAFLAGAGIGFVLKKIYDDTTKLQDAQTQLGNVVNNTGGDWEKQHGAIEKYVGGLSDLSKFSPADLTNDLTRLDGVTQSVSKSERDLALSTNISRATHKPLDTVVRALTLAEAGRTTGLSRLGIVLPKVTTQQDALRAKLAQLKSQGLQVSAAVKSEAMERAKAADGLISFGTAVGGLTRKYGDADKVFGKTGAGHLADLKKNAEELATSVGKVLVPEIDKGVISADDWFTSMAKSGKAERDVHAGITVIGDVFHAVAPVVKGAAGAVGGFGNVFKIALGLYGVKLAIQFGRAIDKDIRSVVSFGKTVYGIGAKAVGVAGKLLGIGGSSEEAAAVVEGDSMTMQESLTALNETILRLIDTIAQIPTSAAEATAATDDQFVVMGTGAEGLQLKITGVSTAFGEIPAAAAGAAEGTDVSLQMIGDEATALQLQIEGIGPAIAAIPAAAEVAAAETDTALGLISDEVSALQLQIEGLDAAFAGIPVAAATAAAETDASLTLIGGTALTIEGEVGGIGTALAGLGAAAASGASTAAGILADLGGLAAATASAIYAGPIIAAGMLSTKPHHIGSTLPGGQGSQLSTMPDGRVVIVGPKGTVPYSGSFYPDGSKTETTTKAFEKTQAAQKAGVLPPTQRQGLTGPSGTPGTPTTGWTPPMGKGSQTPKTPAEKAAAQQKRLADAAAKAQRQFEAKAKADQAKWEKLIASGATPIPTKPTQLDKVLPTGRQAAIEKAEAAAKNGNVAAERHLVQVAQQQLDYLNKEHASGQELVVLERERAKLAGIIAAAHKKISTELTKQTNTAIGRKEEKILGLGPNGAQTSPGQVALKMREHKILDNEIAKMFGGSKHSIAVAAQNLGVSTATLLHGTNEQLIAEMKKLGIELPATTLDSLKKINAVLKNKFLPPDVRANLQARLTQIEATLNAGMTAMSNMKPVKSTDLVKGLGLDKAQKIALEARIAQEMAHGGKVPTGRAADGIPLTSTNTPVGKKPPHAATKAAHASKGGKSALPKGHAGLRGLHGDALATPTPLHPPTELATSTSAGVTINGLSVDVTIMGGDQKTAKQLAREIAPEIINELAKHQLRRGGGT